jgi:hypothetical protein
VVAVHDGDLPFRDLGSAAEDVGDALSDWLQLGGRRS